MGNASDSNASDSNASDSIETNSNHDILLKTLVKSKLKTKKSKKSKKKDDEEFIIKYNKSNDIDINMDILDDQRRLCFVSLIGLYRTWKDCPSYILYSSLLMIPLKRDWIYHPIKYKQELQSSVIGEISLFQTNEQFLNEFIQLLKWKDSQRFVFWMMDKYENHNTALLISPFWQFVSLQLVNLYDPVTKNKYKEINEEMIKQNMRDNGSKFDVPIQSVLAELYFLTMKYKPICEIMYQSNPKSLNPITSYSANINIEIVNPVSINEDGNDHDENWWIAPDYDPYDIIHGDIDIFN